jgi:hypothetical protein
LHNIVDQFQGEIGKDGRSQGGCRRNRHSPNVVPRHDFYFLTAYKRAALLHASLRGGESAATKAGKHLCPLALPFKIIKFVIYAVTRAFIFSPRRRRTSLSVSDNEILFNTFCCFSLRLKFFLKSFYLMDRRFWDKILKIIMIFEGASQAELIIHTPLVALQMILWITNTHCL